MPYAKTLGVGGSQIVLSYKRGKKEVIDQYILVHDFSTIYMVNLLRSPPACLAGRRGCSLQPKITQVPKDDSLTIKCADESTDSDKWAERDKVLTSF